jgi:hypothetical protein
MTKDAEGAVRDMSGNIVTAVFGQLLAFNQDGLDPGYGAVSSPVEQPDGSYEITLMDQATMSVPVAVVSVTVVPPGQKELAVASVQRSRARESAKRRRERRCFWTRPFGHYRSKDGVCLNCGHDAEWGIW